VGTAGIARVRLGDAKMFAAGVADNDMLVGYGLNATVGVAGVAVTRFDAACAADSITGVCAGVLLLILHISVR